MNSVYDPDLWNTMTPASVRGGKARATFGKRDILGRFLSDDPVEAIQQANNLPHNHGQAGGQARVIKAKRDSNGRFVK